MHAIQIGVPDLIAPANESRIFYRTIQRILAQRKCLIEYQEFISVSVERLAAKYFVAGILPDIFAAFEECYRVF